MAKAATLSAQAITSAWLAGMQGASASYSNGVKRVSTSPTQAAATPEAEARYIQNVQAAVSSGKRQAALQRTTLADWQNACLTKGANNLGVGASNAQNKMMAAMSRLVPGYQAAHQAVQGMPKGGDGNAMARWQAAMNAMRSAIGKPS